MPSEISPQKLQEAVEQGYKRLQNFRSARLMFLKQFVGQWYDAEGGVVGNEPLNLIFNAIRVLVPNIVFNFPKHTVETEFLAYREYGNMMGQALSAHDRKINIRDIYSRGIVDAIFTMGIWKTGIADSGSAITFEQGESVDPGTVYTANVDFDNFVFDPNARKIEEGMFVGDKIRTSRLGLLESGLYNNELIEQLPSANSHGDLGKEGSDGLSAHSINFLETGDLEDEVEVWELWVPRAKATVTIPAGGGMAAKDFLRVTDHYGPDTGPYTYLSLTPPVPNNPVPIALVGVWYDLHIMANKMVRKVMDQADRQKSIVGYRRSAADDAQEALDASDGEAVAMDDPDGLKTFQFGGQESSNEQHIQQLQTWFNMMAADPQGMSGISGGDESATKSKILQGHASIGLEHMKDLVYIAAADEAAKRAWFFHTDPLIELPMVRRVQTPADVQMGPTGPIVITPAKDEEVQVFLTPEVRRGDWLDFAFTIEPESMGRVDSDTRLRQAMDFAVKILPAAAMAAQTCFQMGIAFSFPRFVIRMAKEVGITWLDEVFQDPEFQQRMAMQMMAGPQPGDSQGQAQPKGGGATPSMGGVLQNGQPGTVAKILDESQQGNYDAQLGANDGQSDLAIRPNY